MGASLSSKKCSAIQHCNRLKNSEQIVVWRPSGVQPEGITFSKVTFC